MEAPASSRVLDDEDKALKSLLDTFGSVFSLQDIASAFCKAGRDASLAGELLCGMRTHSPCGTFRVSNGFVNGETSSKYDNGFGMSSYPIGNSDCKAIKFKRNPVSMGTVSNVLGKNYVWRPRTNIISNITKPLDIEENKSSGLHSSQESVSEKGNVANSNQDIENFLFEMLGQGFQLERSAIREVLGHCGYDMKMSLEKLLDLTAATLDSRNDFHVVTLSTKASKMNSNSETFSSQNQVQKEKFAESQSRTMRTNGISETQNEEKYEQQKEVLTALFRVPERPELTISTPVMKFPRRSRAFGAVVTEPLKDIGEDHKTKVTSPHLANMKDEEDEYEILRKAVREYRDAMKEYYKAAAEAFSSGDRARAGILLEKGQFFHNRARETDEESARKIFETSEDGEMQDEMCLDLQHHDAKEAVRLVKCHLRSLSGIVAIMNLKIIIGNGEKDAAKRKRLNGIRTKVIKLLEKEAIKWTEDENMGTILIRLDEINPKRLSFAGKY